MFIYAWGQLIGIVGDHDECLVGALAESVDDVAHKHAIVVIETMQWFVKNE